MMLENLTSRWPLEKKRDRQAGARVGDSLELTDKLADCDCHSKDKPLDRHECQNLATTEAYQWVVSGCKLRVSEQIQSVLHNAV